MAAKERERRLFRNPLLCKCGCNQLVIRGQDGMWNHYILGHNNRGIQFTQEHKDKISESEEGKIVSKEIRKKISQATIGIKKSIKHRKAMRGKKLSKRHRRKLREAWIRFKNSDKYEQYIKSILCRQTPSLLERKFLNIVDKYKLPYKYVGDGSFFIEKKNPDFININGKKIAVEVYARYYKTRDNRDIEKWKEHRSSLFRKYGWSVIYFDETEVNEKNVIFLLGGG